MRNGPEGTPSTVSEERAASRPAPPSSYTRRRNGMGLARPAGGAASPPVLRSSSQASIAEARKRVAAEAHVGDPAGPGLCPDPIGPHAQPLGDFLGSQQPVHDVQFADALMWI
jgi:hypothetical protein